MRFLIDAQLPPALATWLADAGFEAEHVCDIGLLRAADTQIAAHAAANNAVVVTKDEDFLRLTAGGADCRIVWVRLGNVSNASLKARIVPSWTWIAEQLEAGERIVELR